MKEEMKTVIYLIEAQKKSNGQLKKVKVIHSYYEITHIPNIGESIF